jgi:hypothetical protein
VIRKLFIVLFMTHVSSCNNSTCGPECEEIEESPVVSGAQTYSPVATTTTQALTIPYCTTEGQSNCIVDGVNFKAVKPSNIDPWDIRVGKTVGGVQGKLKVSCRNRINSNIFNYDGDIASIGTGIRVGGLALDFWDTVDDYSSSAFVIPPDIASDWGETTDCFGLETINGDNNVWKDVTTTISGETSNCSADTARCTLQDKITNLWWSKIQTPSSTVSWPLALNACANLDHNGTTDWRLPTQKELSQIFAHGVRSVTSAAWIPQSNLNEYFWSSTSLSLSPGNAWSTVLADGRTFHGSKGSGRQVICVR